MLRAAVIRSIPKCLIFGNALADHRRQHFVSHYSLEVSFDQKFSMMRRHYSSDTQKLKIQSEMGSFGLSSFMHERSITDKFCGLSRMIDHSNALAHTFLTDLEIISIRLASSVVLL